MGSFVSFIGAGRWILLARIAVYNLYAINIDVINVNCTLAPAKLVTCTDMSGMNQLI